MHSSLCLCVFVWLCVRLCVRLFVWCVCDYMCGYVGIWSFNPGDYYRTESQNYLEVAKLSSHQNNLGTRKLVPYTRASSLRCCLLRFEVWVWVYDRNSIENYRRWNGVLSKEMCTKLQHRKRLLKMSVDARDRERPREMTREQSNTKCLTTEHVLQLCVCVSVCAWWRCI